MHYFSVNETAVRWGISSRRVLKLAKEGRIDGAFQIGNRWLIPISADKPQDLRKKTSLSQKDNNAYKFPLFFYSVTPDEYACGNYSDEEKTLLAAVRHYERAELTECIDLLEKLLLKTENQYLRISILYMLVYAYHDYGSYEAVIQTFHQLKLALTQADHQEELEIIFRDANSIIDDPGIDTDAFSADFTQHYSKEFLIYFSAINTLLDASNLFYKNTKINTASNELLCQSLESKGCCYAAIFSHYYLALSYALNKNDNLSDYHLKAAFDLAEKYCLYVSFLYLLAYAPNYEEIIRNYASEENIEKFTTVTKNLKTAHIGFLKYLGKSTFYLDLTPEQYKYISYAIKGCTIEEMAAKESTSLYNVKKHLGLLYKKFKVDNRKELLEKIYKKR